MHWSLHWAAGRFGGVGSSTVPLEGRGAGPESAAPHRRW
eukprot:COSAG01_NODE_65016_length_274_cov_1.171429_1_plen_38_part_01